MIKHIPNFITCLNILTGAYGVFYVGVYGATNEIFFIVLLAGLFDFLDGLAAKLLNAQSDLGKDLDSLADIVSFGMLPSLFLIYLFKTPANDYFIFLGLLIVVFSAIRLAIFNNDDLQAQNFRGLPTPANAIMIVSLSYLTFEIADIVKITLVGISCFLLVSKIEFISLKFTSFKWKDNEARWVIIIVSILLLFVFKETYFPYIIPVYISISLLNGLIRKAKIF